jgi:hypothetical protein
MRSIGGFSLLSGGEGGGVEKVVKKYYSTFANDLMYFTNIHQNEYLRKTYVYFSHEKQK